MPTARRPPRAPSRVLALAGALTALAGCGAASRAEAPATLPPPTLPASAVAYLPSHARTLSAAGLAHEAQLPGLAARLQRWGFEAGAARYFQGTSTRLDVVDARALRFRSAAGAAAFVAFVRAHPAPFAGALPTVRPLAVGARRGASFVAQACACHRANPTILAMLAGGRSVTWLEINGPRATLAALRRLAAAAAAPPA